MASNLLLLAIASHLLAMASNLLVLASNLLALASNLLAMISNLLAMASKKPIGLGVTWGHPTIKYTPSLSAKNNEPFHEFVRQTSAPLMTSPAICHHIDECLFLERVKRSNIFMALCPKFASNKRKELQLQRSATLPSD